MAYQHDTDKLIFGTSSATRMTISSSGSVGISNTTPVEHLHIKGTNPRIYVDGDSNSYYPSIRVRGVHGGISMGTYHGGNISGTTLAFLTGSNETDSGTKRMTIDNSTHGSVTVGLATYGGSGYAVGLKLRYAGGGTQYGIDFLPNADGSNACDFFNAAGSLVGYIALSSTATVYATSSDYRLKTDAQPMVGATARVQALNPVNFEWIADGTRVDGFLAHEAQAIVPEAVTGTKDAMMDQEYEVTPAVIDENGTETTAAVMGTRSVPDYQGIDQSKIVPLLTAALQEALTKIDDMETRLAALEDV
jgi:hypothetical protein